MDEEKVVETLYEAILLDRYFEAWVAAAQQRKHLTLSFTGRVTEQWGEHVTDDVSWGRKWWVVFYRLKRAGREAV